MIGFFDQETWNTAGRRTGRELRTVRKNTIRIAEEIPEDKYRAVPQISAGATWQCADNDGGSEFSGHVS